MSKFTDELKQATRPSSLNDSESIYVEGQMLDDVLKSATITRRKMLGGSLTASLAMMFAGSSLVGCGSDNKGTSGVSSDLPGSNTQKNLYNIEFDSIPMGVGNSIGLPVNYDYSIVFAAGDAIEMGAKAYDGTARTIEELEKIAGGDHDGMHLFPITGKDPNKYGLLVVNHEKYDPIVHQNPANGITDTNKLKFQATGVGVSIIEIEKDANNMWKIVPNSKYNRRLTGLDEFAVSGPAATTIQASHKKATVTGTLNNCANGYTPWGTYLTCEESDYNYYDESQPDNGYGWVVEIDPFDPASVPVKRTSMGRFSHENVAYLQNKDGDIAFYMGDDSTPGCIYKFIPNQRVTTNNQTNRNLLDDGKLYVAKFKADGTGEWLELAYGKNGLNETAKDPGKYVNYEAGKVPAAVDFPFKSQADVLINAYQAGRIAGGTLMDRPEWITVAPEGDIYCTLTNNSGRKQTDAANPRINNSVGQIIHWIENNNDPKAMTFKWDILLLAGDPRYVAINPTKYAGLQGNTKGDTFSSPDGLRVDPQGRLWVETDSSTSGDTQAVFGNNSLYSVDRKTGVSKRFLVGPNGCEITGITYTPDLTTLFINIQHPDPEGKWPSTKQGTQLPGRSATIAIRHKDGKPFGSK